ncbi:MAG: molecular chaperone DnaJ [Rickettsiales bacterium]|jgi:molecular chaperone DnaJ|nr:molecular chaperone DnaJ [Rickettsiales bacterium]
MNKNPYEILGVSKDASDADIKKAYHKLVMKYHPDKNPGDKNAEEKFKGINNAFDILKDPQKRAAYDRFGEAAFAGGNGASAGNGGNPFGGGNFEFNFGGGNADLGDMIDEMMRSMGGGFGFNMGGNKNSRRGGGHAAEFRGRDMLHTVVIDLKDAFSGKTETVKFSANVKCEKCGGFGTADGKPAPACERCGGSGYVHTSRGFFATESVCPDCNGTGRNIKKPCGACDASGVIHKQREIEVRIPSGIQDGARLRLNGQGEAGPLGGVPGDFYIDVRIRPDKVFSRDGNDLGMRVVVPFATLALGGDININTIDDKTVSVKIPNGTQVGERLRMRGLGMPTAGGGRGDLYIDIATKVPKGLSEKQKKALEEFSGAAPRKKRGLF